MNSIEQKEAFGFATGCNKFPQLFARAERALKQTGFIKNRERAEADWEQFAKMLGEGFFREIQEVHTRQTHFLANHLADG